MSSRTDTRRIEESLPQACLVELCSHFVERTETVRRQYAAATHPSDVVSRLAERRDLLIDIALGFKRSADTVLDGLGDKERTKLRRRRGRAIERVMLSAGEHSGLSCLLIIKHLCQALIDADHWFPDASFNSAFSALSEVAHENHESRAMLDEQDAAASQCATLALQTLRADGYYRPRPPR